MRDKLNNIIKSLVQRKHKDLAKAVLALSEESRWVGQELSLVPYHGKLKADTLQDREIMKYLGFDAAIKESDYDKLLEKAGDVGLTVKTVDARVKPAKASWFSSDYDDKDLVRMMRDDSTLREDILKIVMKYDTEIWKDINKALYKWRVRNNLDMKKLSKSTFEFAVSQFIEKTNLFGLYIALKCKGDRFKIAGMK